jgi:hypothetical protein
MFLSLCIGVAGLGIIAMAALALNPVGPVTIGPLDPTRPATTTAPLPR